MITKGGGGQKSQKIDDVFYEWPLRHNFFLNEVEFSLNRH